MKQVLLIKGIASINELPAPKLVKNGLLIKVINSCISTGTELTSLTSSKTSLIQRALKQPAQIKRVLNMARDQGLMSTISKVKEKLNVGSPVGYSLAGIVVGVGENIKDLRVGDRVAAAGAGMANHAEYVDVPRNLIMRIPDGVDFPQASTVTLGGIAMQGVRRANVQLGEFVAVIGTGILGQLAVQLLNAAGARVAAVDIDTHRLEIAKQNGAEVTVNSQEEDPVQKITHLTHGHGADAVIFCAGTTDETVLSQAFAMTRKKGRVVMVGVYGDHLKRSDLYRKEIDFLISTSYGPGRYDANYEQKGLDYPYAYVRWTENRNMEEYLRLLASGKINVDSIIEKIYPIQQVQEAFEALQGPERPLMVLLDYGKAIGDELNVSAEPEHKIEIITESLKDPAGRIRVGIIGAGGFATGTHLPNLKKLSKQYRIDAVCDLQGHKADGLARHYQARLATTDYQEIIKDPDIDLVMICTRHNLHGSMVLESLEAGKHTFVEKPLCTRQEELDAIRKFYETSAEKTKPLITVGFNRRFSKYAREIKKQTDQRINPLFIHYRMNAGFIPLDHWVHSEEGGGRIIGEACHIIDLFSYLVDHPVRSFVQGLLNPKTGSIQNQDNRSIVLEYEDGSLATLHYFAVGSRELPKEMMEVHFDGKSIILENYERIHSYDLKVKKIYSSAPDKGTLEELIALHRHLSNNENKWPIPMHELFSTTQITLDL